MNYFLKYSLGLWGEGDINLWIILANKLVQAIAERNFGIKFEKNRSLVF